MILGKLKRFFKRKEKDDFDDGYFNDLMEHIHEIENWDQLKEEERTNYIRAKNKLQALTNIIYSEVILDLDGDKSNRELIDDLYCEKITEELTSEELQFILWGHENRILSRAPKTLEAIKQELTNRAIIGYK